MSTFDLLVRCSYSYYKSVTKTVNPLKTVHYGRLTVFYFESSIEARGRLNENASENVSGEGGWKMDRFCDQTEYQQKL